jgi:uncharacterized cysteine cluster protein YcgN (CxxCxxCC family)
MLLRIPQGYCIRALEKGIFDNGMEKQQNQFWRTKALKEMTRLEWESICDHCGRCCLHRIQDGNTGKIKLLAIACRHLDISTCRCLIYEKRFKVDSNCIKISPDKIGRIKKLPDTCAYRILVEGRNLEWWHPLVSGDRNTVHEAGISVKDKVVRGAYVHPDDLKYFTAGK